MPKGSAEVYAGQRLAKDGRAVILETSVMIQVGKTMFKGNLGEKSTILKSWLGACTCITITIASIVGDVINGFGIATIVLVLGFLIGAGWTTVQVTRWSGQRVVSLRLCESIVEYFATDKLRLPGSREEMLKVCAELELDCTTLQAILSYGSHSLRAEKLFAELGTPRRFRKLESIVRRIDPTTLHATESLMSLKFSPPIVRLTTDLIPGALVGYAIGFLDPIEITSVAIVLAVGVAIQIWYILRMILAVLAPGADVPLKLMMRSLLSIPIGIIAALVLSLIMQILGVEDVVLDLTPGTGLFYGAIISAGLFSLRHVPAWVSFGSDYLGPVLIGGAMGLSILSILVAILNANHYPVVGAFIGSAFGLIGSGIYLFIYLRRVDEIAGLRAALEASQAAREAQERNLRSTGLELERQSELMTGTIISLLECLKMTYKDKEELTDDLELYQLALEQVQETLYSQSFDETKIPKEDLGHLHVALGNVYALQGMNEAATTELRKAIEVDNENPENRLLYEILVGTHDTELVVEFFRICGFEPIQVSAEALILEPVTERYRAYGEVLVHIHTHQTLASKDISDVFNAARLRYGDSFEGRLAFIVVSGKPDQPVVHQIFTYRLETGLTVIPLDKQGIQNAMFSSNCSEFLSAEVGSLVGEEDLYDLTSPITNPLEFFGRNLILDEIRGYIDRSQPIGLFGVRKIGKTSLLYALMRGLPKYPVAYLDLQYEPANCSALYAKIVWQFSRDLASKFEQVPVPELRLEAATSLDPASDFERDVQALGRSLAGKHIRPRLVLCLDEVDNMIPGSPLSKNAFVGFGEFLRAIVRMSSQSDGLLVPIVCGFRPTVLRTEYWGSEPNAAHGFAKEIYLKPFPRHECSTMMTYIGNLCGLEYSDALLDSVYFASGGHPFIARKIGSYVLQNSPIRPVKASGRKISEAVIHCRRYDYWDLLWEHLDNVERSVIYMIARNRRQTRQRLVRNTGYLSNEKEANETIENLVQYGLLIQSRGELGLFSAMFREWILEERPLESPPVGAGRN